jgi:hypothetical protein
MSPHDARTLTNDFQDIRLCCLRSSADPGTNNGSDHRGPYLILQTGIDPQDPTATVDEFILSRQGHWLPLYLYYRLPEVTRVAEFLFPTAAVAIAVLQNLTGTAVVDRTPPTRIPAENQAEDPPETAIRLPPKDTPLPGRDSALEPWPAASKA